MTICALKSETADEFDRITCPLRLREICCQNDGILCSGPACECVCDTCQSGDHCDTATCAASL